MYETFNFKLSMINYLAMTKVIVESEFPPSARERAPGTISCKNIVTSRQSHAISNTYLVLSGLPGLYLCDNIANFLQKSSVEFEYLPMFLSLLLTRDDSLCDNIRLSENVGYMRHCATSRFINTHCNA
ncbi:unnamed protein product, partial [Trichogramma brassicae]